MDCMQTRLQYSAAQEYQQLGHLNNFTKGVEASPDGRCILTNSEDHTLRLFEDPMQSLNHDAVEIHSILQMKEAGTVYDMKWYPHMDSLYPSTCFFITTSKDQPIHLWDAYNGQLRASFRAFDHLDELTSANSVCFNITADKIYAGFERTVRVFDLNQPSRDFVTRPLSKTKKSKEGQRGIISTMHFNPDCSKIYAAGSYHGTTGIYAEDTGEELMILRDHDGKGITQVRFSYDGRLLLTSARQDNRIQCWDIRKTNEIIHTFHRISDSNQRIEFDLHIDGKYIATGSQDGHVYIYDLLTGSLVDEQILLTDSVNGMSFFPHVEKYKLAITTGQRHYQLATDMCDKKGIDARIPLNVLQVYEFERKCSKIVRAPENGEISTRDDQSTI